MSPEVDPTELSQAIAELQQSIEQQGVRTEQAIAGAAEAITTQLSAPLADLEVALRKGGANLAKALTTAMAEAASRPAPQQLDAQQLTPKQAAGWVFKVKYHANGSIDELIARRLDS